MKTKRLSIKKIIVSLVTLGALVTIASGQVLATPLPPDPGGTSVTPPPPPASTSTLGGDSQCQGDSKSCVCPSNKPDCGGDAAVDGSLSGCAPGVSNCNILTKYLNPLITLLSVLVGIAVVIGLIIGGVQYSASGGDPQKVAAAKKHIRNSILALLAFFFLYAFLKFLVPGGNGLLRG